MRAKEFIIEYKEYPTREYEGVTFTMKEKDGQLIVKPLNDYGISMGHVVFNMDGNILDPQDLVIADKYQGQGIAKVMYDYIKSQGFTIERSWDQTPAGKGFWDKHRGEDVRVWEGLETGRNLNPETEKYVKDHKWKLTTVNPMDLDVDSFDDPYNRVIDIDVDHPVNFKDPIILDSNGVIIDGFHRAYQAQRAGLESIPAYVPVEEQLEESTLPSVLYHATYRPLLKSIKQHGLGGDKAQAKWEDSKPGVVYLATSPDVAESYAESSDVVPEEWLDKIVVLKIDASKLDQSKLMTDQNVLDNSGDTLEYHGVIPLNLIS